jgi:tetratricopeptide (TPR) repeat protein
VVNYANFLEEHEFWEESFKVYERGIELFSYPIVFEIWNTYLSKFIKRYGGAKMERARDLFEQALETCPEKFVKPIFLLYAQLEESHGLAKRAMAVLERATEKVALTDRFEVGYPSSLPLFLPFFLAPSLTFFFFLVMLDVYVLYRQGDRKLWAARDASDLRESDQVSAEQPDGGDVSAVCEPGAEAGGD